MTAGVSTRCAIEDYSQVGAARREAMALAGAVGLDEESIARAGIVATEAAGNIAKHAGRGEIILRAGDYGLDILALDRGPGIADLSRSMTDGYSTAGSPGTGLGAMARQADEFDIYAAEGKGAALFMRLRSRERRVVVDLKNQIGAVSLPLPGQEACGDGWDIVQDAGGFSLLVADGLGHGVLAADAAALATRELTRRPELRPGEMLVACHAALAGSRGAAVAMIRVDTTHGVAQYAGCGNISGTIIDAAKGRGLVSQNGIVGHKMGRVTEMQYPAPAGALLIMHSDGIGGRWKLDDYPGLRQRHPGLIAGVLYRDFARGNDDATVVAVRFGGTA